MFAFAFVAVIPGSVLEEPPLRKRRPSSTPLPGACRRLVSRTTRDRPGGRGMDRMFSLRALQTRRLTGADVAPGASFDVKLPRTPGARPIPRAERSVGCAARAVSRSSIALDHHPNRDRLAPRLRPWDERDRLAADTIAASGDPPVPGARCWLQRRRRRRGKRACA
jgi:hypothetical protein